MGRFSRRSFVGFGSLVGLTLAGLSFGAATSPADWPQWRGPERDGISRETGWMVEGKADSLWEKSVGLGYSSVVIADGRLYTIGFDESRNVDVIWCLDALTGEEIWNRAYPAEKWAKYHGGGTNCTPSVDGERVFVAEREGKFFCLAAKDGAVQWEKDLVKEFGVELPTWGLAASPLVLDDMVVFNAGQVIAFNKESGEVIWKTKNYGHAYATPVDCTIGEKSAIAVFAGDGLAVIDRNGGSEIFTHEWKTMYDVNAATPIVTGDRIFISSGYGRGCAMLDTGGETPVPAWENKSMRNKMSGCVLWEGHLYGFDDPGMLVCIDLDGNEKWRERGLGLGALALADGKLIIVSGKGALIIAEASPDAFTVLSNVKVVNGGVCWTVPVIANGLIYVRNSLGNLVCRDHRSAATRP